MKRWVISFKAHAEISANKPIEACLDLIKELAPYGIEITMVDEVVEKKTGHDAPTMV